MRLLTDASICSTCRYNGVFSLIRSEHLFSYSWVLLQLQARGAGVTLILCPLRIEGMEVELAAPSKLFAPIDETKMAQVIRNLVSNAIKFTQAGGSVEVRMTFHPSSSSSRKSRQRTAPSISRGHARVEIVDTGCGVSAAQQKDLFKKDRQFNTANSHGATGSGLGLFSE